MFEPGVVYALGAVAIVAIVGIVVGGFSKITVHLGRRNSRFDMKVEKAKKD